MSTNTRTLTKLLSRHNQIGKENLKLASENDTCNDSICEEEQHNEESLLQEETSSQTEFEAFPNHTQKKQNLVIVSSSESKSSSESDETDSDEYLDEDEKAEILAIARQMVFDPEKRKLLLDQRFTKLAFNYGPDAPQWYKNFPHTHAHIHSLWFAFCFSMFSTH
jgi:hypothetical protein